MKRVLVLTAALVLVLAGCRESDPPERASTIAPFTEVSMRTPAGHWCALLADAAAERAQGLMQREDLGGYDAMVFSWTEDTDGRFFMKNTPLPLSIAFFTAEGTWIASFDMDPCLDRPQCPTYGPDRPYRYAVEVPQGELGRLGLDGPAARLQVGGACTAKRTT